MALCTIQDIQNVQWGGPLNLTFSGDARAAVVITLYRCDATHAVGAEQLTCDGNNMTLDTRIGGAGYGADQTGIACWYYLNPGLGVKTIASSPGNTLDYYMYGFAIANTNQTDPVIEGIVVGYPSDASGTTLTATHTNARDQGIIIAGCYGYYGAISSGPIGYTPISNYIYYKTSGVAKTESNAFYSTDNYLYMRRLSVSINTGSYKINIPMTFN